jgi:hypothetical protein
VIVVVAMAKIYQRWRATTTIVGRTTSTAAGWGSGSGAIAGVNVGRLCRSPLTSPRRRD